MDKNRIFLRGAVVLLIVAVMIFSSVAVANTKSKTQMELFGTGQGTGESSKGNIVWDNGMHYTAFIAAQWDPLTKLDPLGADDFQFEETTIVTDVHWIGGYWNPAEDGDFDWNVSFYTDRGDGMAPGTKIYEQVFPNSEVHETFIEDEDGQYWYFSYKVDFPDPISFTGGEKYWVSFQGLGAFPPQSHLSGHDIPVVLYSAKFKSDYFGYPDWTDVAEITGGPGDGCFQLTGEGDPVVADLDCDGDLRWVDIPPGGTLVNGTFTVINSGDFGSMLEWEIKSVPDWMNNYTLNWTFYDKGGFVGASNPEEVFIEILAPEKSGENSGEIILYNKVNSEDTCSINVILNVPRTREINYSPLQKIFQQFPNLLPILRQLFGL